MILLLFVFSLGLLLSGELVRPFEKLTREIQDVKAGFSSAPASVNDYLETENMVDAEDADDFDESSCRLPSAAGRGCSC